MPTAEGKEVPMNEQAVNRTAKVWPSRRGGNILGFVVCALALATAYLYFQNYLGLNPCPLCIFQRIAMFVTGMVFLAAALQNPGLLGARVYAILILFGSASGVAIAARHVWIQHLPPDQVPSCGPSLEYMLQAFSLGDTIRRVLAGSGDCAVIDWTFLSLSIPAWVLVIFIVLGLIGVLGNWRRTA